MGVFIFLIALLGLAGGILRNELLLTLVGAVFLAVPGYCFAALGFLSWLHRKKIPALSVRMLTKNISAGTRGEFIFSRNSLGKGRFFRLPGMLIRYVVKLETRDGRRIHHLFDPDILSGGSHSFAVPLRGAYYSGHDELLLLDMLGFFRVSFSIPQDRGPRLLALPGAAAEPVPVYIRSGGDEQRREFNFLRTDNLIDHRPYIPGDDPRRINWKLYSHGGELFVREGEPEPPPHSKLTILVDTQADGGLYGPDAGRRGVDLLCEKALATALEYAGQGMDVSIGYTGGEILSGSPPELAEALAYPAAAAITGTEDLPLSPAELPGEDRGFLILALPRTVGGNTAGDSTALDRLLRKRGNNQAVDLVFLYDTDCPDEAAETCVHIYGQKGGVHARRLRP
jgi:uncharacterized protein (DUF58 family)